MVNRVIIVMNPQNDFIDFHQYEGEILAENIATLIRKYANNQTDLYIVQDTHSKAPCFRKRVPCPLIASFGWDVCSPVAAAIYDTRYIYNDIYNKLKADYCAEEALNNIQECKEIYLMGFELAEDILDTALRAKEKFPAAAIKIIKEGCLTDIRTFGKLKNKGIELI